MDCIGFKNWLVDINAHDRPGAQEAQTHMANCPKCQKLYDLDRLAEEHCRESFAMVDPPVDLYNRIKLDIPTAPTSQKGFANRWRTLAPALAASIVILIIWFNFLPGGAIRDIDHIGTLALANHLDDRQSMEFKAGEIKDAATWFVERIGFAAATPNLAGQGYVFKGGRPCKLGSKGAAYLFYEKNGKNCSLFVINPDDLNFAVEDDKKYYLAEKNHAIEVWSESGLVYAMIN